MSFRDPINPKLHSDYSLVPFFETSPDFLCIAGFDGYFKKINPAFCQLLGYTSDELYQKPIEHFIHPEDRELTAQHRRNIHTGKSLINFENRYLSKEGDVIWLSWNSTPKTDEQLIYAIAKNISHTKKLEAERNQFLSDLTDANKRLKQLNYMTSHDLRSPVSNLLSIFHLWDKSTITDPEALLFVEVLENAAEELKQTLDRYLDNLQRDDTQPVDKTVIHLGEVIHSVKQALIFLIEDAKATFQIELNSFETVLFNRTYLESIFLNLITNSIKYAHPDRNPIITIKTETVNGSKQLIFSDNGLGFDSEKEQDKVFGLNQKFHHHSDSKGVGLYLVYNHMTSLGGNISVRSKVQEGTTFTLTFK